MEPLVFVPDLVSWTAMPRYHFHIIDGVRVFDPQGMAFPDASAARDHARGMARSLGRALGVGKFKIKVTDEKGQAVYVAHPDKED